jgi:thioredoxin-like negative regulator of GroEL
MKPQLVFFHSARSGRSRRVEGYLAQVLQRRANHHAFQLLHVDVEEQPTVARRFGIRTLPTLVVIEGKRVEARLEAPTGCEEIKAALTRWLA